MSRFNKTTWFLGAFTLLISSSIYAIELPPLFSDHMVLQRGQTIVVKGKAEPESTLVLTIGDTSIVSFVDEKGTWKAEIPSRPAGGPFNLNVVNGSKQLTVKDVYFGDVWLASGQSNMEWKLKWQVDNWQQEVKDSHYPLIRYFDVRNRYLATEQQTLDSGEWKKASEQVSGEFSAVAWFFAKRLHLEKNVPVAIIDSSWGGTPAEAWTPMQDLLSQPGYEVSARSLLDTPEKWDAIFKQTRLDEIRKNTLLTSTDGHTKLGFSSLNYQDNGWTTTPLPLKNATSDILWLRTHFYLENKNKATLAGEFHLGYYPPHTQVYVNGSLITQAEGAQKNDPFHVPAHLLKSGDNLLSIRSANAWDNRVNVGSKDKIHLLIGDRKILLSNNWKMNNTLEGKLPMPEKHWQKTSVLYNAMVHPIIHFPLKGVIWYQGESNIDRASEYHALFTKMIESWRERWQQPSLPFIFAQLASMHAQRTEPYDSSWALLREAQTKTLALPNTAMVVLIDAGEAWDIHPRNKQIVGERMWHAANGLAYNKSRVFSGPSATAIEQGIHQIVVSFKDVGSGLQVRGDTLVGFEVAGADGKFVNASAKVTLDKVAVWNSAIPSPQSIRYAWADNSAANLYNKEGFPALPFRMSR